MRVYFLKKMGNEMVIGEQLVGSASVKWGQVDGQNSNYANG